MAANLTTPPPPSGFGGFSSRLRARRALKGKEVRDKMRADAEAAGLDPRSIDALIAQQAEEESKNPGRYNTLFSGFAGVGLKTPEAGIRQREDFSSMIKSEASSVNKLRQIRSERQKQVQRRASKFLSGRGNPSLLTSSSGGAGFLSGYFK